MLKQKDEFSYETEQLELNSTILESMFHNLDEKLPKMKIKFNLKNLEEKKNYEICLHRAKEREDAVDLVSSDEE